MLARQTLESGQEDASPPTEGEADHFFSVRDSLQTQAVIEAIVRLEAAGSSAR